MGDMAVTTIGNAQIIQGHVLDVLRAMPEESVNCCVTSPPYWGLRDYGIEPQIWDDDPECEHEWGEEVPGDKRGGSGPGAKEAYAGDGKTTYARQVARGNFCSFCGAWRGSLGLEPTPELYVKHIVTVFYQVWRVLRPDGTCWVNLGDSYAGSWGAQSRDDGSGRNEIARRMIQNAPKVKSHAGSIPKGSGLKPKDLIGIPWRVAFALQAAGWWLRQDIIWSKPNPMPESVRDRCTKAHEYIFLLTKSAKYWYDADAIKEPAQVRDDERPFGNAGGNRHGDEKRVYKMPDGWSTEKGGHGSYHRQGREKGKSGNKKRKSAVDRGCPHEGVAGSIPWEGATRNKRDVWEVVVQPFPEAHFATYPMKLVEPCILAGCPPDGVVLDPFHGSGTTGVVALNCRRKYVGIEIKQDYIDMSISRITEAWRRQHLLRQGFDFTEGVCHGE
jgi:DNA modification methylase